LVRRFLVDFPEKQLVWSVDPSKRKQEERF
jgi:hypothetical protein